MIDLRKDEREFLISLIVDKYNRQYGKSFKYETFDIKSIPPTVFSDVGYEVTSIRTDDNTRMRVYFSLTNIDLVTPFRVELEGPIMQDQLGDEVFVAFGSLNIQHVYSGEYRFTSLTNSETRLPILLEEGDNGMFLFEDLGYVYLEEAEGFF